MSEPRLRVLFEVPEWIRRGLDTGEMVRRGGVVQWAKGTNKGEVVAWLRESGNFAGGTGSPMSAAQAASLSVSQTALLAGQLINLSFSVVSFAVLNAKLTKISRQLQGLQSDIRKLAQQVEWLDEREDAKLVARFRAALESSELQAVRGLPAAMAANHREFGEVRVHYWELMRRMRHAEFARPDGGWTTRAHAMPSLYSTYFAGLSLATIAQAAVDVELNGLGPGAERLRARMHELVESDDEFARPVVSADVLSPHAVPPSLREPTATAIAVIREIRSRVDGQVRELDFCATHKLSLREWKELGEGGGEGIVLLVPEGGT